MSLIQLRFQGPNTSPSRMFECRMGEEPLYTVVPRGMYNKKEKPGIPVIVEGVPYVIWSVYSTLTSDYHLYLYAAEGPYTGFKGPEVHKQVIEVTVETLKEHFNYCAWRRADNGDVVAVQFPCDQEGAIGQATERGYMFTPPALPVEPVVYD